MYVEVKVTDTGKGISESNQAAIFRRFYREEEEMCIRDRIKAAEKRMAEIAVLRTHIVNYAKTSETYVAYRKAGYSRKFREEQEEEIPVSYTHLIYLVGIYCRLSKDDGTDNESASIATQKSILTDYVKKQGWHIAKTYVDDGYSGTNFQRPSFQNMIKDIESGLINCVITKDLSRLGRNYLDCGLYLEVFFPEHNVRYIAVNDGVDTLNKSAMDITPFRNILNEMYAADISVKIKSAYRARFQQGKFMGTTAPYGYIKDPADHNHLLIDDKVAHVVKEIFDLALKGNGVAKICRHLNKQHILRPAAYAAERGETGFERHFEGNEDKRYIWSGNSVRSILRSPIYAGNLVGYKRIAANMKSKKRPSKLPEEWEVIPNLSLIHI